MRTIVISKSFLFKDCALLKEALDQSFNNPDKVAGIEVANNKFAQPKETIVKNLQFVARLLKSAPEPKTWTLPAHKDAPEYYFNGSSEVPIDMLFSNLFMFLKKAPPKPFKIFADSSRAALIEGIFRTVGDEENTSLPVEMCDYAILNDGCAQIIFDSCDYHSAIDTLIMDIDNRSYFERQIRSLYVHESLRDRITKSLSVDRLNRITTNYRICANKRQLECTTAMALKYGCKTHVNAEGTIAIAFDAQRNYVDPSFYLVAPITVTFFREISDIAKSLNTVKIAPACLSVWTENITTFYSLIPKLNDEIGVIWCNSINELNFDDSASKIDGKNGYFVNRYEQNGKTKQIYIPYDK